jgi:MFS family permease
MTERDNEWADAAAGLRMIAGAMIMQLVLVAFTVMTIVLLAASKKPDGMQGVAIVLALLGLMAQIAMVMGVFRFSRQPPPAPSSGMAQSAGAFALVGLAVSLYVLFVLMQVSSVNEHSDFDAIESAMKAAERLPKFEVLAAVVGFTGMVLLLVAAGAAAAHFRRDDLVKKSRTAIGMVVLAAAVFAFITLGITPTSISSAIAALVMAAVVQIAAFVNILGTVRGLADALLGPPPPELPQARAL